MNNKPTWDEYYFGIADAVSHRATCPRLRVGAVVDSKDNYIIGCGYNGAPAGFDECIDVGCRMEFGHCTRAIHAEMNAIRHTIISAGKKALRGATMYVTHTACEQCTKRAKHHGIERIVWKHEYRSGDEQL